MALESVNSGDHSLARALRRSLDLHDVMHGCNPSEHTVNQSSGVTGQKLKCCIAACTGTPSHLDNCHFAAWMPQTLSCDHRSPHRPSTSASKRGHMQCTIAFMDKGAQVQPESAAYALPQLRITTTTPMEYPVRNPANCTLAVCALAPAVGAAAAENFGGSTALRIKKGRIQESKSC